MRQPARHIGIILVNLGTPEAPTTGALRRYLREFLGDPRVVEAPRWLWWLVLNGIILRTRPAKSARNYQKIWTAQGSPLLRYTQGLAEQMRASYAQKGEHKVSVRAAMRYGEPHLHKVLAELREAQVTHLLVLPLFPQYSASTTGSVYDCVGAALRQWRFIPHLRVVGDYHLDHGYVNALAESVAQFRQQHGAPRKLLFSFHGIPQRYADRGDPYPEQCQRTAVAVASRLGLHDDQWQVAFQSRFGREPWLQPYTDETLALWAAQGVDDVHVICPGFAVDCLETIEEIAQENAHAFLAAGGKRFQYIPALNDSPAHVAALRAIADAAIHDWRA